LDVSGESGTHCGFTAHGAAASVPFLPVVLQRALNVLRILPASDEITIEVTVRH
jgi:hypothetical protein